ncbi:hypothetical protein SHXM_02744 [Streptomyces hygroscopicus]|nr:hypothetical protein SHXM_02744 [Streptomyces hygroscopicus]
MPYGSAASLVVGGVPVAQRAQTAGQVGELEGIPAELSTHGMPSLPAHGRPVLLPQKP